MSLSSSIWSVNLIGTELIKAGCSQVTIIC